MTFKVMQMILRGFCLMLLTLGLFFNSESEDLTTMNHFITTGIYGCYIVITLGLIIEAGLGIATDPYIESVFLGMAIFFNAVNSILSFYEYYALVIPNYETMNKGFVSITCAVIYMIDLIVLHSTK